MLLVYRDAKDFYILALYPATLPNSLMRSNSFFVTSSCFPMGSIMSSANSDTHFFFLILFPFISFLGLISIARTSNIMLSRSFKNGHPCLIPDYRGKAFIFLPLSVMLAVGLSYMVFILFKYVASVTTLGNFYFKWLLNFVKNFYSHIDMIM